MDSKVYLRAVETSDVETTFLWRNDDEISSMVGGQKYFVSMDKERKWIDSVVHDNTSIRLMVCLKENEKPIGMVTMSDINYINRTGHSHILIGNKDSWGKGYGTEALKLLLEYAFEELNLNRVEALVLENNTGSVRMHKKCGYIEEGLKRESIYKEGTYHNQVIMSVLANDYKNLKLKDIIDCSSSGGGKNDLCVILPTPMSQFFKFLLAA